MKTFATVAMALAMMLSLAASVYVTILPHAGVKDGTGVGLGFLAVVFAVGMYEAAVE